MDEKVASVDVRYFNRSMKSQVILTLCTGGLYVAFWHYKNWAYLQPLVKEPSSPAGRGLFNIFYCHRLFANIHASASKQGYTGLSNHGTLATIYVCLSLPWGAVNHYWGPMVSLLFYLTVLIPISRVQPAILFNNAQLGHASEGSDDPYTSGEKWVIAFGALLYVVTVSIWIYKLINTPH